MIANVRTISFHPKMAAVIDAVVNVVLLYGLQSVQSWWMFSILLCARIVLWAILIRLVYYPKEIKRVRHFISLIFFSLGLIVGLMIFVDWIWSWRLLALTFILFSFVSFWLLPEGDSSLSFMVKPYRRWLFLMDVFGLAGLWGGMYAILSFQLIPQGFFWLEAVLGMIISAVIAGWWWRAYDVKFSRRFWLGLLLLAALIFELSWIVWRWPLGYKVNGIIMVWFWYNLWLIIRFNLSKEGINWRKQIWFLSLNLILFILFLLIIKWK